MNYLQKKLKKWEEKINIIFRDSQMFKKCLRRVFEDIDKKCTAEWQLYNLWQKIFAATYSISFQHIVMNMKWNNAAFISQFYQKLREKVKNEITKINKLSDLQKMIFRVMIINNKQYKKHLKKDKESTMSIILSWKFKKRWW